MSRELAAIVWTLVVLAGVAVLSVVAWWTRRWMYSEEEGDESPVFTLQDLREMRDRGSLSEAEFERMRAGILASYGAGRSVPADEAGDEQ